MVNPKLTFDPIPIVDPMPLLDPYTHGGTQYPWRTQFICTLVDAILLYSH